MSKKNNKHIIIIGAGVIGLHSGYLALKNGYKVTILEQEKSPLLKTSFQNGAQLSFSHSFPVDAFSNFKKIIYYCFFKNKDAIFISKKEFFKKIFWFIKSCYKNNHSDKKNIEYLKFANFSKKIFETTKKEIKFEKKLNKGIIHLFQNQTKYNNFLKTIKASKEFLYQELTQASLKKLEKNIIVQKDHRAILLKNDLSCNLYDFSGKLYQELLKNKNFNIHFNSKAKSFIREKNIIKAVKLTNNKIIKGDKFVLANAIASKKLVRNLAIKLPIIAVRGYSFNSSNKLNYGIIDHQNKIVCSALENKARIAGFYDILDNNNCFRKEIFYQKVKKLLIKTNKKETIWQGIRVLSQDGFPIIGGSKYYDNLYYNLAHCNLGWTLSFASSQILIDKINQKDNNSYNIINSARFKI